MKRFQYDIYVSFSQHEATASGENAWHWVTHFQRFLDMMLGHILGHPARIATSKEGLEAAKSSALFIAILSPEYFADPQCDAELEAFVEHADLGKPPYKNRIFCAYKTRTEEATLPAAFERLHQYLLYPLDEDSPEYHEFFGLEARKDFWMKLVDLCYDMYAGLWEIRALADQKETKDGVLKEAVYLAETGPDLVVARNILKRELKRYGYRVLPESGLPDDAENMTRILDALLPQCRMAIHLIGNRPGRIPTGGDLEVVEFQNRFVAKHAEKRREDDKFVKFSRLIWVSNDLDERNFEQQQYVEDLRRDVASMDRTEILQTPLEDFKRAIRGELLGELPLGMENFSDSLRADEGISVYLIYDHADQPRAQGLLTYLRSTGVKVLEPRFEGDLIQIRRKHLHNLKHMDAAIIFAGDIDESWLMMKLLDIRKAPGFGRHKPLQWSTVMLHPDNTMHGSFWVGFELPLLKIGNTFDPAGLQPYMDKLMVEV